MYTIGKPIVIVQGAFVHSRYKFADSYVFFCLSNGHATSPDVFPNHVPAHQFLFHSFVFVHMIRIPYARGNEA